MNYLENFTSKKKMDCLETNTDGNTKHSMKHDTLDFNPKIKAGFDAIELLKEIDDYLSPNPKNHIYSQSVLHEKIKSLLSKVSVDTEVS